MRSMIFLLLLAIVPLPLAAADRVFTLDVYEGFNFADNIVVPAREGRADVFLSAGMARLKAGMRTRMTLEAARIREFGKTRPKVEGLSAADIERWGDSAEVSGAGAYYVLKGLADGKYYLLRLDAVLSRGRLGNQPVVTASWQALSVAP